MIFEHQNTLARLREHPKIFRCTDCHTLYEANPVTCDACEGEIETAPLAISDEYLAQKRLTHA